LLTFGISPGQQAERGVATTQAILSYVGKPLILQGKDSQAKFLQKRWFIIAKQGDGPQIPCVPAVVLAQKLVAGEVLPAGAYPCVGLISLAEYMAELQDFKVQLLEEKESYGCFME
jgi:hypothetical protein